MKRKRKDRMESLNLTPEQRTAITELLQTKDMDFLRGMLAMVYDTAIQAQFDEHIGARPHERSEERRDQRNGTRQRGLNTRWAASIWKSRVRAIRTSNQALLSISDAVSAH
jgi:transposase-like protein